VHIACLRRRCDKLANLFPPYSGRVGSPVSPIHSRMSPTTEKPVSESVLTRRRFSPSSAPSAFLASLAPLRNMFPCSPSVRRTPDARASDPNGARIEVRERVLRVHRDALRRAVPIGRRAVTPLNSLGNGSLRVAGARVLLPFDPPCRRRPQRGR
jgi:hypothetical protein